MPRYVDIDKLLFHGGVECGQWITEAELEDAVEEPGHWLLIDNFSIMWECSICHRWQTYGKPEYCPRCGHRMVKEE